MSTLVTSVAPMLIMDGSTAIGTADRSTATVINSTINQYQNGSSIQQLSHTQQQPMLTSTTPAHLMQPAQYNNGIPFPYAATNYTVAARNVQLQSQPQPQPQIHLNTLQQQQQQFLSGMSTNAAIAYHHQQQQCSMQPSVATSTSTSHHPTTTAAVPATTTTTSTSINRSQRCGVCRGCQCKPCGTCTYCQDSPQFGGPGVKKQSCIERRCLRVLENRLQRDAPTFKARIGCNNCDDCKMPDCQICLVCLDRRFFNNRYMNGALCAKKRCNNATSLELSPQGSNNNNNINSADRNQQLKRSYDNNNYDQVVAKRRGMDSMSHLQTHHNHHKVSHKNGIEVQSTVNFQQNSTQIPSTSPNNSISPPSSNCSQQQQTTQSPSTTVIPMNKNVDNLSQQRQHQQRLLHQTQLQEDQKYGYRPMYNGAALPENGTTENYRNNLYSTTSIPTTTAATIQTVCGDPIIQQHLPPQNGSFYVASTASPFFNNNNNIPHQFDMAAATAAGLPPTQFVYQPHQQPQLQSQFCCNNYIQQQKFSNYPKYEYYDEHTVYNSLQTNGSGIPPPDPFVPPSYSELKNAVVLQPL